MIYAIYLYDGVEPIDLGATFGVLSIARRIIPEIGFFGVAKSAGEIVCANNFRVQADHALSDMPVCDEMIVTGGPGWVDVVQDDAAIAALREIGQAGLVRLTGICTGGMILAHADCLASHAATTKTRVFAGETPPIDLIAEKVAHVSGAALVQSGRMLTSGGITLGIDAVFQLIARNHGAEVAGEVARVMEYDRALTANKAALGYEGIC